MPESETFDLILKIPKASHDFLMARAWYAGFKGDIAKYLSNVLNNEIPFSTTDDHDEVEPMYTTNKQWAISGVNPNIIEAGES